MAEPILVDGAGQSIFDPAERRGAGGAAPDGLGQLGMLTVDHPITNGDVHRVYRAEAGERPPFTAKARAKALAALDEAEDDVRSRHEELRAAVRERDAAARVADAKTVQLADARKRLDAARQSVANLYGFEAARSHDPSDL